MSAPIDPELEIALATSLFKELEDARDMGGKRYAGRFLADSFRQARLEEVRRALGHCCCLCAAGYKRVRREGQTLHEHPGSEPFEACASPDELIDRFEALDAIPDTGEPPRAGTRSAWRAEHPTEPGYYWLWNSREIQVVRVDALRRVWFTGNELEDWIPGYEAHGVNDLRWLGPIAPPAAPQVLP